MEISCSIRIAWINTYVRPPNLLGTDAAEALISDTFRTEAGLLTILSNAIPARAAFLLSITECYDDHFV